MKKGNRTRAHIIRTAAAIFNESGYDATSVSALMEATGLEKGGIYGHFSSKKELALEAFDYNATIVRNAFTHVLQKQLSASEKLTALARTFVETVASPLLPGGCPLLNASVESDDTDSELRERVRTVMGEWKTILEEILRNGVIDGEFKTDTNPQETASILIAIMEGSVMLYKLYDDSNYLSLGLLQAERLIKWQTMDAF